MSKNTVKIKLDNLLDADQSRRLLEFCLACGVDCFTVTFLESDLVEDIERADAFFRKIEPFEADRQRLEQTSIMGEKARQKPPDWFEIVPTWKFNKEAIDVILETCEGSFSTHSICELPEDWIFYRNNDLFLGFVTHEGYAFLRLLHEELEQFKRLDIPYREET